MDVIAHNLNYDLLLPPRIVFGWGRRAELPELAKPLGRRALLVSGSRTLDATGRLDELIDSFRGANIAVERLAVITREPEVADVDDCVGRLSELTVRDGDFVVAVGGGSAIDLGKAVAAMATNREGESVRDYLEGVGRGLKITNRPLPMIALPTTAGTGSEATKNAVISCYDPPFKKSLRSDLMVPRVVLIDPELTVSAPKPVTAHSGMDALTQLIESFISRRAKPVPRALCRQGIELALRYLVEAVEQPESRPAREAMSHAALLSGIALANSGLGMAHGVAAALGVHCRVPHGLACAVMLPTAMQVNRDVRSQDLAEIGKIIDPETSADRQSALAIETVRDLGERIGIPAKLSELGVRAVQIPAIVRSSRGNSMSGNPRALSDDELTGILEQML